MTRIRRRDRTDDPDGELVSRIASGERQALDALYLRHASPLLGYLVQISGDRGTAEEILQDTFVAVWRGASTFRARSSVKTWLFGIARRQAHNVRRRRNFTLTDDSALDSLPSSDPDPEASALINAERQRVKDAIARLGEVHREVLVLAFAHDLSYDEMAEILDVPTGTIKSRLSNAKRLLRQILKSAETES